MTLASRRPDYRPGSLSDACQVSLRNAEGQRMVTAAYSADDGVSLSLMEGT